MGSNKENKKSKLEARYTEICRSIIDSIPAVSRERFHEDTSVKRVAVYIRVGSDELKSDSYYELQRNLYENMVRSHQGWILVEIYMDKGVSGMAIWNRNSFKRMISDCKDGKIDLIVTKSIPCFSRNVVDFIRIIKELAALPNRVGVYFETEGIFTLEKMPF